MTAQTHSTGTFSAQFARRILAAAVALDARPDLLMAAAGLDAQMLLDAEARLPLEQAHALFDAVEQQTGETFGLEAAKMHASAPESVLGLAVHSSQTLGDAYRRASRYVALVSDTLELRVEIAGAQVRLTHHQSSPQGAHPRAAEYALAMLFLIGRKALGEGFVARRVSFRHAAPASTAPHDAFFGIPVQFAAEANQLVVDAALLDAPMPGSSERIAAHLDELLENVLRSLPRADALLERVRAAIAADLRGGNPTLESIAERFHMVPRTLQRHLRQATGKAFHEIRDELRRELAQQYLTRPGFALAEVSYLLGFSEPSTFHRAFRRWTGTTPDDWRRARGVA